MLKKPQKCGMFHQVSANYVPSTIRQGAFAWNLFKREIKQDETSNKTGGYKD